MPRRIDRIITAHRQEEGGGFIVRRPFPTVGLDLVDPFLLLDEMGPIDYGPGEALGAPDHPHRGFETVTYVLQGTVEHHDSAGHQGTTGPGAVQWMTAGAGVVHREMPAVDLRELGGRMHGFQLWVNLPRREKMIAPRYQEVPAARIPEATTPDGLAHVRVIAGEALGVQAVIETRTPIMYQHWTLQPGAEVTQSVPAMMDGFVYVFGGELTAGGTPLRDGQMGMLSSGTRVTLSVPQSARVPATCLLIAGEPLGEPVARYGPFVMNTRDELVQAFDDYRQGKMGVIRR